MFSKMIARPEKRKELSQTLQSIIAQVRNKPGSLHSGFYQNIEDENEFLLVEEWSSQEDFYAHSQSDLFTVLKGTGSLMQRPMEVVTHALDTSTE
jgi:quinol monooxygenase YgiN